MSLLNEYSELIFKAFLAHNKKDEIVAKKAEIINKVLDYHNLNPEKVLFKNFNPAILELTSDKEVFVENVSDDLVSWLNKNGYKVQIYDRNTTVDCIVAMDEYFTFTDSEQAQVDLIKNTVSMARQILITSLKDYKNLEFKDKEHSSPSVIKTNSGFQSFNEIHDWSSSDYQKFQTSFYTLSNTHAELKFTAQRRAAYFKQLAKFSHDAGGQDFVVHKNLMYKSLLRKNYEHVLSVVKDY